MAVIGEILRYVCLFFFLCLWIRVILSYFAPRPGGIADQVNHVAYVVTEPILGPVRRVLPPLRIGMGAIDLSFIVVMIFTGILMGYL